MYWTVEEASLRPKPPENLGFQAKSAILVKIGFMAGFDVDRIPANHSAFGQAIPSGSDREVRFGWRVRTRPRLSGQSVPPSLRSRGGQPISPRQHRSAGFLPGVDAAAKDAGLANTAHIAGGIDAWKKAGGPVLTG